MDLSLEFFRPLVGSSFEVLETDPPVELKLMEATDLSGPSVEGRRNVCFSLVFRGPARPALGQGNFTLRNHGVGDIPLFIVPIATIDANSRRYEAVFNTFV